MSPDGTAERFLTLPLTSSRERGLKMLKLWSVVAMVILVSSLSAAESGTVATKLYVAKNGSDQWSGRLAAPNKAGTDGPLATLEGARDAVRREIVAAKPAGPITVYIRKGTYFLDKTFELTSADSGTRDCPITYEAYRASKGVEEVIISGGRTISGFGPVKVNGHDMIAADIPEAASGRKTSPEASVWNPDQLFVNDRRAERTRLPKQDWYMIKSAPPAEKWQDGQDTFTFNPGEIRANWHNLSDVEVLVLNFWVESRMPIRSVDEATNTVSLAKKSRFWLAQDFNKSKYARFIVENVFEALDTPGQWYLDRPQGKLYYYPRLKEDWSKAEFIAPRLETLVKLAGTADAPVQFVTFRNLRFSHNQFTRPIDVSGFPQAAVDVPGAVNAAFVRNCEIDRCEFSRIGTYAIEFGDGSSNCTVRRCSITDMGAGGVKISHGAQKITVSDNEIRDGGKIFPSAVGVWIGSSPHNKIVNNSISELNYTGISVGWSWGYAKSGAVDNLIALNHIHHIGRGVLSDLSGIYTLGVSPGTILRNNLIHDAESFSYGGWGIYTDEGSSNILIKDNIVYRTKTGGFHQHYGKGNILTNNVFAFAQIQQLQRTKSETHKVFTFERNIVFYDNGPLLGGSWGDNNHVMDYNLYFDASGKPVTFAGASFEEWQKRQDQHSLIADPLFADPKKGDFRLRPESPAFKLGFKQIDMSKVGPREKAGVEGRL